MATLVTLVERSVNSKGFGYPYASCHGRSNRLIGVFSVKVGHEAQESVGVELEPSEPRTRNVFGHELAFGSGELRP